ncbi:MULTISPECIES: permease [Okeania]|uniref:Permease n=1 Tax=Okeania hirsuta TaxID=1458930 RepID=A0A3N6QBZ7_9CYAN|nr:MULTISPECIES: permease [Okeania]NET15274.1 permease [Okeania sp. SIO1H6]NES79775.1 permease [Okeania sp. SIO1H4]NET23457.1 permease [Okeania sp. SIO1H5]NET79330.1 permease [Okeania sp. SIO1F9]NET97212.1 permease [Okeania sp. SIO1H2]
MASTLTNQLNNAFTLFLSLLVEAIPFLLLGVILSGILQWFIDERKLITYLPKNPLLGAFVGSLVGFLFPVCECGNVPVARRLLLQGVPVSVAIGFLLAAPTVNPIVIWATWTAFRDQPEIVVLRVVFSLAIATIIGWVFSVQKDMRPLLQPKTARLLPRPQQSVSQKVETSPLLQSGTFFLGQSTTSMPLESIPLWQVEASTINQSPLGVSSQTTSNKDMSWKSLFVAPDRQRLLSLLNSMVQELQDLGGVLVIGSAIAAMIQVAAPREFILSLGQSPISSIIAMLTLAAVVSICSTVDAFFALSFAATFTSGSLLAFLVFGPMIDIKAVGLLLSVFRSRVVIYLMVLAAQLTFIMALIVNLYLS